MVREGDAMLCYAIKLRNRAAIQSVCFTSPPASLLNWALYGRNTFPNSIPYLKQTFAIGDIPFF